MLIDTHTHIYLDDFSEDIQELMHACKKQNISKLYLPNIDSTTIVPLHKLVDAFPEQCFPMMGLHPCYVKESWKDELAISEENLRNGNYLGVGEIGIDLYWDKSFKKEQIEVFCRHLEIAKELKLPVSIHSRDALEITISEVRNLHDESLRGVFHCFNGTAEQAKEILDLDGFYMGIGGVVTYKNAGVDKVVKNIPLDRLVLETDAPYLPPVPFRGKRNEPAYLVHIASKIAEIKEIYLDEVAEITSKTANSIFS